jgi:hypothetical protein
MCYIFDPVQFDAITAIVQNCEIGVILGLARSDMDLMRCIEEYNYALFYFLISFMLLFGSCCVAGGIRISPLKVTPIGVAPLPADM